MKIIIALMIACSALADEIPLLNGKTLRGEIVGTVPASVKLKTESGNIVLVPLTHMFPESITNLPDDVSAPYKLIEQLKQDNRELSAINKRSLELLDETSGIFRSLTEAASNANQQVKSDQEPRYPYAQKVSAKVTNKPVEGFVEVAWKADIFNPADYNFNNSVKFRFLDAQGFPVAEGYTSTMILKPGLTTVSDIRPMQESVWRQVKKYEALID